MPRLFSVYKITNTLNGRYYIGKHVTNNIHDSYMGSGKLITQAIEKYGRGNFVKEIIKVCESEIEMNQVEKDLVEIALLDGNSYNLRGGGDGGWDYINLSLTADCRAANIKPFYSSLSNSERKEKYGHQGESHYHYGKPMSDMVKQKISVSKIGTKHTEETKARMKQLFSGAGNAMYGRTHSPETIAKLKSPKSEAHKRKLSDVAKRRVTKEITCPHCSKVGAENNMKRYHFDRCKNK